MRERPGHADTLDEVLATALRLFSRGVADRRSAFRVPTLASVDDAGVPRVRTVVLRSFEPTARCLTVHTDRRSGKVGEIRERPRVGLHVWDGGALVQVRLDGRAVLHVDDALAEAAWARTPEGSRLSYAMEPPPGTAVAVPPDAAARSEAGAAHFAVLRITFDRLEWLWLGPEGHRRAAFAWDDGGTCRATWLAP